MEALLELFQIFLVFFIIIGIIVLILTILNIIGLWTLFKKTGHNGWKSIIPFYNSWILIKISELNNWYFLALMSFPICNLLNLNYLKPISNFIVLVTNFFIYYNISKKFHKDLFFTVLLFLFPYIMIPILGMSKKCIYDKSVQVSQHGPIKENKEKSNAYNNYSNNNQNKFCPNCGNKLDDSANFCRYCGNKTNEN